MLIFSKKGTKKMFLTWKPVLLSRLKFMYKEKRSRKETEIISRIKRYLYENGTEVYQYSVNFSVAEELLSHF